MEVLTCGKTALDAASSGVKGTQITTELKLHKVMKDRLIVARDFTEHKFKHPFQSPIYVNAYVPVSKGMDSRM